MSAFTQEEQDLIRRVFGPDDPRVKLAELDSVNARYKAMERMGTGFTDARGLFGSNGVGAEPARRSQADQLRDSMRNAVLRRPATAVVAAFMEAWRRAIR